MYFSYLLKNLILESILENKDAFKNKNAFIASSSGGNAEKFQLSLRNQLTHIGSKVFDKTIIISDKNKLDDDIARKDINAFIKLL